MYESIHFNDSAQFQLFLHGYLLGLQPLSTILPLFSNLPSYYKLLP